MRALSGPRWLIVILCTAFALRAGLAIGLQHVLDHRLHRQFLIEGDANGYWELAERIADGRDFCLYEPPRHVLRMPGFPALLAVGLKTADAFGLPDHRGLVVRLLLALIGTAACGMVYGLGRAVFDERTGLVASAMAAVSPALVGFSILELSETAFAAALLVSLWCFTRLSATLRDASSTRAVLAWGAASGTAVALAQYMRPSWVLAAPLFAAVLIVAVPRKRDALLSSGMMAAAIIVCLFPWAWRNERATGHWVWTTLWSGPSLYDGLNPHATGDSDMRFFDQENLPLTMSEYEVDREYSRRAVEFVRSKPTRALTLGFIKLGRFWNPVPNAPQFRSFWLQLPLAIAFALTIGFAAVGCWAYRDNWVVWEICVGPVLYFSALHSVFVGSLRYRLPAEYPLLVVSAAGFLVAWNRLRQKALP